MREKNLALRFKGIIEIKVEGPAIVENRGELLERDTWELGRRVAIALIYGR